MQQEEFCVNFKDYQEQTTKSTVDEEKKWDYYTLKLEPISTIAAASRNFNWQEILNSQ